MSWPSKLFTIICESFYVVENLELLKHLFTIKEKVCVYVGVNSVCSASLIHIIKHSCPHVLHRCVCCGEAHVSVV